MISLIVNLLVAYGAWHYIDIDSGDFITEAICPIIFAVSIVLLFIRIGNWFDGGGSGGGSGGWFGGGGFGDGGGSCGGGDAGC
ncbi:hypothetical protein [Oleiphilus messinensis]|uniref:hypothetical protein n=1 Tax=Oleiphilus messinensis TaxID=141451 RepID=UPI000B3B603B|nr:hypothetical protein [Oleiphilus messinensis]